MKAAYNYFENKDNGSQFSSDEMKKWNDRKKGSSLK